MSRMTAARVERWQKDLNKVVFILKNLDADLKDAYLNTAGLRHSAVRGMKDNVDDLLDLSESIADSGPYGPITRLRSSFNKAQSDS